MEDQILSVKNGLKIQKEQLNKWRKVLKPSVFRKLNNYVLSLNKNLTDKHTILDVPRGTQLDNLIQNYMLGHEFGSKSNKISNY